MMPRPSSAGSPSWSPRAADSATRSSSFTPTARPPRGRRGAARGRRACRRIRALEGAPPGNDGTGSRLPRHHPRSLADAPRSNDCSRSGMAPSRCRLRSRWRAPAMASPLAPALGAYLHALAANLDLDRRAADAARPDRRTAAARRPRADGGGDRRTCARRSPLDEVGAARSAPISPACATRPNIRGCSGSEYDQSPTAPCESASAGRSVPARPR